MIAFSAVVGSVVVYYTDRYAERLEAEINDLQDISDTRWDQHLIAHNRLGTADVMYALVLEARADMRPEEYLLIQAGSTLNDAITTLWAATPGADNRDRDRAVINAARNWQAKLKDGDLTAYLEMVQIYLGQHQRSVDAIQGFREEIDESQPVLRAARTFSDRIRDLQTVLYVLGLVVVILRDIPIWSDSVQPTRRT